MIKARSFNPSATHEENGVILQFENSFFSTSNIKEEEVLRKHNGRFWTIVSDSKHKFDKNITRPQLVKEAANLDYVGKTGKNPATAKTEELMEFLRYS